MNKNTLWDNFFIQKKSNSMIDFLKSITLFEDLKTDELIRLERTLYKRHYEDKALVINVKSGSMTTLKYTRHKRDRRVPMLLLFTATQCKKLGKWRCLLHELALSQSHVFLPVTVS